MGSAESRELRSRPPLDRMMQIHAALQQGTHPNCTTLAAQFEVATKTIQRDIEFMRDRLRLPIAYVPDRFGFAYTEAVENFPLLQVTEGDLMSLFLAQKALAQHPDTPFKTSLRATFRKLASLLPENVSVTWSDLDAEFSFRAPGTAHADVETFRVVTQAVQKRRELAFDYRKLGSDDYAPRVVRPYHVACIAQQWYLFAHDLARDAVRTFVLARMRGPALRAAEFRRPASFSVERLLRNSFGVVEGGPTRTVRVRFDAFAARLVRERAWHPSQRITDRPGGAVDVTLELGSLFEVERWILGWGEHAEVLAPAELRRRVAHAARALAARYR